MTEIETFKQILEDGWGRSIHLIRETKASDYHRLMCDIKSLKELTEHINFDCQFESRGCKQTYERPHSACCCRNCAYKVGYLSFIPEADFSVIVNSFDNNTGFWRKDKGCILPRRLRSLECITYHCNPEIQIGTLRVILREYETKLIRKYGKRIDFIKKRYNK